MTGWRPPALAVRPQPRRSGPEIIPTEGIGVRRATPADGPLLRELRLRALREDADAFRAPLEREEAWPAERWTSWPERQAVFVAHARASRDDSRAHSESQSSLDAGVGERNGGGEAVGLVAGFLDEERPGAARLVAMWVASEARGTGAGRALVEAVADWAAAEGATTLMLDVLPDNAPGQRLYERAGFTPLRTDGPLDTSCGAEAITLARAL